MNETVQILTSKYGEPIQPPTPVPASVRVLDTVIYVDLGTNDSGPRLAIEREEGQWVFYIHGANDTGPVKIVTVDNGVSQIVLSEDFDVVT